MRIEGAHVLVVEDQPIIAMAVADSLEMMGAAVVGPASTLAEALQLANEERFDAALLDISLGSVPVFPVGDILAHRGIPFVVMSGAATAEEPAAFKNAPRLVKPFKEAQLQAALEGL